MTKLFSDDNLEDLEEVVIPDDEPLKPFLEKYKDDKGVAKAIVEKDKFILRLQRENAEARANKMNETNVAEIVDRLLANKSVLNPPVGDPPANGQNEPQKETPASISLQDVEKLLEKKEQVTIQNQNLEWTKRELKGLFGDGWEKEVIKRAKEIGESAEFMDTLAKTKPNVLLSLLKSGQESEKKTLFQPQSINSTAQVLNTGGSNTARTMKYYKEMKAKNLVQYNTPAIQNQMHKDALQLREAFFDA